MPERDLDDAIDVFLQRHGPLVGDKGPDAVRVKKVLDDLVARLGTISERALERLCEMAGIERRLVDLLIQSEPRLRDAARGQVRVLVCEGSACFMRRSGRVLLRVERVLGLKVGQSAPDGSVGLARALCLGHCENGPNIQIGAEVHEGMTPEKVERLLQALKLRGTDKQ